MKRKVLFCLLLIICITMVFLITGCSSSLPQDSSGTISGSQTKPQITWQTETEEDDEDFQPLNYFPLKPTIDETVLYDSNEICITAKEITYNKYQATVSLLLENKTKFPLEFYSNTLACPYNSVNGHMLSFGYMCEEVPANDSAEATLSVSGAELSVYNIWDIADLEIAFYIHDDDNNVKILTGPCSLKTSLYDEYDYSSVSVCTGLANKSLQREQGYTVIDSNDAVIFDKQGVQVNEEMIMVNQSGETIIIMEAENTGDQAVYLEVTDVTINGLMVNDGLWTGEAINPGKTASLSITVNNLIDDDVRTLLGIEEYSDISFEMILEDMESTVLASPVKLKIGLGGKDGYDEGTEVYRDDYLRVCQLGNIAETDDDCHLYMIFTNNSDSTLYIRYPKDALNINNNSDISNSAYSFELNPGASYLRHIRIWNRAIDELGISSWSEMTSITLTNEVKDNSTGKLIASAEYELNPEITILKEKK